MKATSNHTLLSHELSRRITEMRDNLPQSVLFIGSDLASLQSAALDLSGGELAGIISPTDTKEAPDNEKGIIRVKQIREVIRAASTKSSRRRIYIIDGAEKMNEQAQNAFLKILEEPATATHFILCAATQSRLLPTIISRVQIVNFPLLNTIEMHRLLKKHGITDPKTSAQIAYLSVGRAGMAIDYISDPKKLVRDGAILKDAQTLINGKMSEKIMLINQYGSDRQWSLQLIELAHIILVHTLDTRPTRTIVDRLTQLAVVNERIRANGNVKLQLLAFVV